MAEVTRSGHEPTADRSVIVETPPCFSCCGGASLIRHDAQICIHAARWPAKGLPGEDAHLRRAGGDRRNGVSGGLVRRPSLEDGSRPATAVMWGNYCGGARSD